jgi:hypothetical protein
MSASQEVGEIFGAGSGPAHAMLRSPTVLIASVGLWGMNVYFFRLFGLNYAKVLKHDLLQLEGTTAASSTTGGAKGGGDDANLEKAPTSGELSLTSKLLSEYNNGSNNNNNNAMEEYSKDTDYDCTDWDDDEEAATTQDYSSITWMRLVAFSISLLFLLHATYFVWIDVLGGGQLGAVFCFYGVVLITILVPFPSTRWLRKATVLVLQRLFELINPRCGCVTVDLPRPIPFVDVFFADALCSLSKVFFDWGMLFHMASHYPHPVPSSPYNILIPSAWAAIPFSIRARQCVVMYNYSRAKNDPKRLNHVWNAIKYTTSILPLCLSAYQKTVDASVSRTMEKYLIFLLVVNALYALYWDIVHDWGMMQKNPVVQCVGGVYPIADQKRSCAHTFMRPRLRFGVAMSAIIVVCDAILRFSWTLRFYHKLFPSGDSFVLCTQFLEVFRRAIWNLLRVEWENFKQSKNPNTLYLNVSSIGSTKSEDAASSTEMQTFLPLGATKRLSPTDSEGFKKGQIKSVC